MRALTVVLCGLFGIACLPTLQAQQIVAHRGASFDAPENTLAAFRLAWDQGADAIEGDFYLTRDRQIVCLHDKTTKRVAPKQKELVVAQSTLAELQQLDVGSWKGQAFADERMPTLREVLATVPPGKQILVEIKCGPEILPVLQTELAESGLDDQQVLVICFSEAVITQARQQMPQYKANWLTSYKQTGLGRSWAPDQQKVLAVLQRSKATGLGTNANLDVVDDAFAGAVAKAGFELHAWTVNSIDAAKTLQALGVQSITTDRPLLIRDAIQSAALP